jgi:asparagine synthase (glutamine-hydrolysing)
MMRAMVHRGPDDEGFQMLPLTAETTGPGVGFGFRRLAILDLSPAGHQPMINPATGDCLVFNGEIYNFRAIRERLQTAGHTFKSSGDSEVLLKALSEWGEGALCELDGMFAFAFYDARARRVLLARDPLGIKPLYASGIGAQFVFASEVRAVLASGLVPAELDRAGIASFLAYGSPQDPLTVHRHIRSMPPGSCEWVDVSTLRGQPPKSTRFWTFPCLSPEEPSEADVVGRVRSLLEESVRRQCLADVPIGVFLSGGIDSATIAALARTNEGKADTFAVGYDVAGVVDETKAAAETAEFLGTRHFQSIVDDEWVMLQWSEWLKAADRPSIDGLNTYIVSGAVRDRHMTVALSGLGADEIFGGYPSFNRIPRLHQIVRLVSWLPQGLRRRAARVAFACLPAGKRAKVIDLISSSASIVDLTAMTRRTLSDESLRLLGFKASQLGLSGVFLPPEAYGVVGKETDTFSTISRAETCLYMGHTLLRDSDVNSMAHSLELRVPFLGRALVDYSTSLPGDVRAPKGSQPKHLLRRAVANLLPDAVFTRRKQGFSLPFGDWLFGPLRDQCEAAIASLSDCSAMDGAAVRRAWSLYESNRNRIHWSRPMTLVVLGSYLAKVRE